MGTLEQNEGKKGIYGLKVASRDRSEERQKVGEGCDGSV